MATFFQRLFSKLGRNVLKQPAAAAMAFPVTTPAGRAAIQNAGATAAQIQPKNIYAAPTIQGLQGGDIAKSIQTGQAGVPQTIPTGATPPQNTSFGGGAPIQNTAITSESLAPQQEISLSSSGGSTTIGGFGGGSGAGITSSSVTSALTPPNASYDAKTSKWTYTPQDTQVQDTKNQQSDLQKMMESLNTPTQESVFQNQQYQQAEQERRNAIQEQNRISGQITSIVNQAQAAALSTTGQGRGIPEAIIGGQQAQIYKEAAIQALPLQAQLAVAQGNVQLATDHLKDITNVLSEQIQIKYQKQVKVYDAVRGFMDKSETARLNAIETQAKYAHEASRDNLKMMDNLGQELAKNGQGNLIPSVMRLNPSDPNFRDNYGRIAEQIKPKATGGGSPSGVVLTPEQSSDPFIKTLLNSAGGKALTDTPLNQLNKGFTVLGQLGALQSNIKDTNTGPLVGLFRGANPWDTNAQTIKAQLNAIVPNLARGIYGEVGVLTDADVKLYSQTLPNLKSTEDLRNAVLYITLDQVAKSIGTTMRVQAAGGRDVSGFVEMYSEMRKSQESILSQINVQVSPEENDVYGSVVSSGGGGGIGGFFSDIWKGLTGK